MERGILDEAAELFGEFHGQLLPKRVETPALSLLVGIWLRKRGAPFFLKARRRESAISASSASLT